MASGRDRDPEFIAWGDQAEAAGADLKARLEASLGELPGGRTREGDRSTPLRRLMSDVFEEFPDGWIFCPHLDGSRPSPWIGTVSTKVMTCDSVQCILQGGSVRPLTAAQETQCDACGALDVHLNPALSRWGGFIMISAALCPDCFDAEPPDTLVPPADTSSL